MSPTIRLEYLSKKIGFEMSIPDEAKATYKIYKKLKLMTEETTDE